MAKSPKPQRRKAAISESSPGGARPGGGPVTLAEARKIAASVKLAVEHSAAAAKPRRGEVAAARQGAEIERRKREWRKERARRVRGYKPVMQIMKSRGAIASDMKKGSEQARISGAASFAPLQIFAEGDSWFDYPFPFFGGGIVPRLENLLGVPILNLAKAGDEARYMLGVEQRKLLAEQLAIGCPAGEPWDVLLFSGGGNDIVGNPLVLWIKDWKSGAPPKSLINQPRYDAALALVRSAYEDLIEMRGRQSPGTQLIFHAYDFAIPDGRGVCSMGPWLKPAFDARGFPNLAARAAVVKQLLLQFAFMLSTLAARPGVVFINGQGTLVPQTTSWHNELHPAKLGFDAFAQKFQAKLKALFPGRVA